MEGLDGALALSGGAKNRSRRHAGGSRSSARQGPLDVGFNAYTVYRGCIEHDFRDLSTVFEVNETANPNLDL
jgi:hypothetical protein